MKTKEEIKSLGNQWALDNADETMATNSALNKGFRGGYAQCQEDMADKIKEAVNLLDKIVENTELFFGYDVANKNSNIRNAKIFIKSLNKQD